MTKEDIEKEAEAKPEYADRPGICRIRPAAFRKERIHWQRQFGFRIPDQ